MRVENLDFRQTRRPISSLNLCFGLVVLLWAQPLWAEQTDARALSAIFDEQHAIDATLSLHNRAAQLAPAERFALLSQWVLPNADHPALRLQVDATATHPAPPIAVAATPVHKPLPARAASGGALVSPVLDLLEVADHIDRLADVQHRVEAWDPGASNAHQMNREAFLALLAIRQQKIENALKHYDRLIQLRAATLVADQFSHAPSAAELLMMQEGLKVPELRDAVADLLSPYRSWMLSDHDRPVPARHVGSFFGRLQHLQQAAIEAAPASHRVTETPLTQWHSGSRATARTRGDGQPPADWSWQRGSVANIASHDDDYLYFSIPLRGDYEVECDVTGFDWLDSHLMVAGTWVAPVYTHKHYDLGSFRAARRRETITPALTKIRHWIHYRTVVRDGTATTYFNGRPIHTEPLGPHHDPWLAIRSSPRHEGGVRNLRITGRPEIPSELHLSAVDDLSHWVSYYEDDAAQNIDNRWYIAPSEGTDNEIIGLLSDDADRYQALREARSLAGEDSTDGYQENLLRYHRPMLENGVIEYEFYYLPDLLQAHPALDRLVFLVDPDGVRIHWLTDGPYDRTGLSVANTEVEEEHRRGPATLPLKVDDWNRMQVAVDGDVVTLTLNGEQIYERPLEPTNQRTFGLFYYADRTNLRVRRVIWRGDWPRELPSLAEQELAIDEAEFLDRHVEHLQAEFHHDFATEGLPQDRFTLLRGNIDQHLRPVEGGLLATRDGTGGYRNATVAPSLQLFGDFDVIAEYNEYAAEIVGDGKTTVALIAFLENDTDDEFMVARREYADNPPDMNHVYQCVTVKRTEKGDRRNYFSSGPMEERTGRLRLARRGDQIYYLTAEGDSPHFQLRGQQPISDDAVAINGMRLLTQIYGMGGHAQVIWKSLSIRAERLAGPALEHHKGLVAELNTTRDQLAQSFTHNFRIEVPTPSLFYRWSVTDAWQAHPEGWLITNTGSDRWTASGVSPYVQFAGDFDAEIQFDASKLARPKPGKHTQVYLQLEIPDQNRTQLSGIFSLEEDGETYAFAQVRDVGDNGEHHYRTIGRVSLTEGNSIRLARRGNQMTVLAGGTRLTEPLVVARYELAPLPIESRNLRFMVHTGGDGRTSRVRLQSWKIQAEQLKSNAATGVGPTMTTQPAKKSKGVIESIYDYFTK